MLSRSVDVIKKHDAGSTLSSKDVFHFPVCPNMYLIYCIVILGDLIECPLIIRKGSLSLLWMIIVDILGFF